jgi:hypothetical protein
MTTVSMAGRTPYGKNIGKALQNKKKRQVVEKKYGLAIHKDRRSNR